ncbi:DUF2189 domain-containing protein [Thioalkalivibrio sp. XN279]|uniref:DUF2189 domain-containing protein n=1 Tax=Thioalkalivibrio sp. XN279 TaxID=2714953 RepID=UPI00140B7D5C|nr:DUF2189 domain-containing protein [Thioalkalivibrio sp. XN279]NHA14174.1 DUF2189 domain-containing protein [Thioalkalivibrio sp. XN279]
MDPHFQQTLTVRRLAPEHPLRWLRAGWADFCRTWPVGMAHGVAVVMFALLVLSIAGNDFWLLAGAFSGFLLVAPVIAVGLYAVSRELAAGRRGGFKTVYDAWMSWRGKPRHDWRLVIFGCLLALAGTGWVLTSAALITALSPEPINSPVDFLRHVVASREHYLFELWLMLGAFMAAPVFASSVITLPLLLDRQVTVLQAVTASWLVVLRNPGVMALWAGVLAGLSVAGLAVALLGSLLVVPLLGHASWHAYTDAVDAEGLPARVRGAP